MQEAGVDHFIFDAQHFADGRDCIHDFADGVGLVADLHVLGNARSSHHAKDALGVDD